MRLLVLGGSGMLGRRVVAQALAAGHEVIAPPRSVCDVRSAEAVFSTVLEAAPDVVLNCAGCLPGADAVEMLQTNAVGPHLVAAAAAAVGASVVHMSTDCVFSGRRHGVRGYRMSSRTPPDPVDAYGRSKLAGEVMAPHVLNVRGSFVAPEGGFLRWLLEARGPIVGWHGARWNGTTADIMARTLVQEAGCGGVNSGVVHRASPTEMTKLEMVELFAERLQLPVVVEPAAEPRVWRVLLPDWELPDVRETLLAYAEELRSQVAVAP